MAPNFAQAQITVSKLQCTADVVHRQQYQQVKESLPDHCQNPGIDVAELTANEAKQAEREWHDRCLDAEQHKLAEARRPNLGDEKS